MKVMKGMLVVFIVVAVLMVGVAGCVAPKPEGVYKLGLIAPLTGGCAHWGPPETAACEVAVEKINREGGILGRTVELVIADNASEAEAGTRVAKRLILEDKVDAIIGTIPGTASYAVAAVCDEYDMLMLMEAGCSDCVLIEYLSPYFFNIGTSATMEAKGFLLEAEKLGPKKVATIGADFSWGRDNVDTFKKLAKERGLPWEFVGEYWIPLDETNFSPYVTAIMADAPELVAQWLFGDAMLNFLGQAEGYGLLDKMTIMGWGEGQTMIMAGKAMPEGIRVHSDLEWWALDLPQYKGTGWDEFKEAYMAKLGTPPAIVCIDDYMSTQILFEAIRRCNSFDRDKIAATIETGTFDTVSGERYFRIIDHQMNGGNFFGTTVYDPDLGHCTCKDVSYIPAEDCWLSEEEILARRAKVGFEYIPWSER